MWTSGPFLKTLRLVARAKGFLRARDPHRRDVWRHRVAFYDRVWREAAEELGASFRSLGDGFHEIELGGVRTRVNDNASGIDDPVTLDLLSDKAISYRLLEEEGLPTPGHASFTLKSIGGAVRFLKEHGECVVKPTRGTGGGRGITSGVRTIKQLAKAAAHAGAYCKDLIIETQVPGENYRLLYLDGELIDAFIRRPPTVLGDGRSSVKQLVKAENAHRLKHGAGVSQVLLTIDMDMRRTLATQGLTLRSTPMDGQTVVLKTVVNENRGSDNETVVSSLCPAIIEEGARAARGCGARLAGVDVITRDPSVSLSQNGGVVLEVNGPPNFYYHYHKRDGVFPVALHVLRKLLAVDEAAMARGRM